MVLKKFNINTKGRHKGVYSDTKPKIIMHKNRRRNGDTNN